MLWGMFTRRDVLVATSALAATGTVSLAKDKRFFVPTEEEPHARTFMQWPVSRRVYRDRFFLSTVQDTIAEIANSIAEFEPVAMLADSDYHANARRKLSSRVELWDIPTEDLWCRDAGPIFVVTRAGDIAVRQIQFNGWGEKQINVQDSKIAGRVAEKLNLPLLPSDLKGEAGGIEQDGHGLLIAHESSWRNNNRNPGLSREVIEARLLEAYGADRMIWSPCV